MYYDTFHPFPPAWKIDSFRWQSHFLSFICYENWTIVTFVQNWTRLALLSLFLYFSPDSVVCSLGLNDSQFRKSPTIWDPIFKTRIQIVLILQKEYTLSYLCKNTFPNIEMQDMIINLGTEQSAAWKLVLISPKDQSLLKSKLVIVTIQGRTSRFRD